MTQETVEQAIHRTGKRGKIVFRSCLCVVMLGVIGMTNTCTLWRSHVWSRKVVAQWKQPDDVKYDGYSPYYLSVVERDRSWNPLSDFEQYYAIYVGKDSGPPSYGHVIDFTFWSGEDDFYLDKVSTIKKTNVEWQPEGITMTMTSGHKLFIPQKMFTGGR